MWSVIEAAECHKCRDCKPQFKEYRNYFLVNLKCSPVQGNTTRAVNLLHMQFRQHVMQLNLIIKIVLCKRQNAFASPDHRQHMW